ncbi:MAG: hypothetical protein JJU12_04225 [Chlamydiales bacterium]|nr:hypothetical protein [Chlamydiales bacterium]
MQISEKDWIDSTRHGKLLIIETNWKKIRFILKNLLLFGAPSSRVVKVVYYTYVVLTLELNNPFDKRVLMFFLAKKLALLNRLLRRLEKINGRIWDQTFIKMHLDTFHRNSLLQYKVIRSIHQAIGRQKVPPIVLDAQIALKKGLYPILITKGCSGAYWMRSSDRKVAGLFKPFDEEIHAPNNPVGTRYQGAMGQRRTRIGCRVGEAAHREVGAFLVDSFLGFGIVPRTYYARFTHRTFFLSGEDRLSSRRAEKAKYGSFQEYLEGFVPFVDIYYEEREKLPLVEFQLLIVLDVIIGNLDRNAGNILVGDEKLAAIDHGLCFPDTHDDLSCWYWDLNKGKEPLIPSLVELLDNFPFETLSRKLKKNCFISENSISRLRERVVLFREAIHAGLVPKQLIDLMKPDYLVPLMFYKDLLPEKARDQVEQYKTKL